jgi:hypothetical protein
LFRLRNIGIIKLSNYTHFPSPISTHSLSSVNTHIQQVTTHRTAYVKRVLYARPQIREGRTKALPAVKTSMLSVPIVGCVKPMSTKRPSVRPAARREQIVNVQIVRRR